eukprot:400262_1
MSKILLLMIATTHLKLLSLAQNNYFVAEEKNSNNIYGAIDDPDNSNEWVTLLGIFPSEQDCINACIANSTNSFRCETYTWHNKKFVGGWANHCYGRFGYPLWTPIQEQNVNSGRIIWKCQSDIDCFLNGKCKANGNCTCNEAYSGPKCDILNLLPAKRNTGYNQTDKSNNKKISSWGGAVLMDTNNTNTNTKYHMFAAQFDNYCGVNSWELNSIVIHAQSTNGLNSPFEYVSTIHHSFAHEPDATKGPNGEYVIYYVAYNYTNVPECNCNEPGDGSTNPVCQNRLPYPAQYITVMQYSNDMKTWSDEIVVFPLRTEKTGLDTNLAGVIKENGEFIGLMRIWDDNTAGSEMHLATASNWKDGSTYKQHSEILFPELVPILTEDPFVYVDCNGYYHAIFHNMSPNNMQQVCGGHAFSEDGMNWIYTGYIYSNVVDFTDGSTFMFERRERPHFVFDDDGCTPIALTNGVQWGGVYDDSTYTLLQPIKH